MSNKKPNMKTRPRSHKEQARHELEELLKACNGCLDVSFGTLHSLVSKYSTGPYRDECEPEQLQSVENYITTLNSDLKDLEERLKKLSVVSRSKAKDYKNPENNLIDNIRIHQTFDEWTIDYQSTIVPTMLELVEYMETLDNPPTEAETTDE